MKIIPASFALLFLPTSILAAVGGRCVNNWGGDCICLDSNICRDKWGGTPYTGFPGNYPCPNDPHNIMACVIKPCPGQGASTQCLWKDTCSSPSGGKLLSIFLFYHAPLMRRFDTRHANPQLVTARVCPGGNDFICCNHHWS